MPFSPIWMLAAGAYAAIAATALVVAHWSLADLVWTATFFATVAAAAFAVLARGRRQVAAAGFAVASALVAGSAYFAGDSAPTARVVTAAAPAYTTQSQPGPQVMQTYQVVRYASDGKPVVETHTRTVPSAPISVMTTSDGLQQQFRARVRTANALATMLAGLVGAVLGATAQRRACVVVGSRKSAG